MEIIIRGETEEIAAFVLAIQKRQVEKDVNAPQVKGDGEVATESLAQAIQTQWNIIRHQNESVQSAQ